MDEVADRLGMDPLRCDGINLIRAGGDAVTRGRSTRSAPRWSTIPATIRCCSTRRWTVDYPRCWTWSATSRRGARAGELVGLGIGYFVEKSGLGPFDGVRDHGRSGRRGRGGDRRGLGRPGHGDRRWRRSAPTRSASTTDSVRVVHGQTDRIRDGMARIRLAGHRDDRLGDPLAAALSFSAKASGCAAELLRTRRRTSTS